MGLVDYGSDSDSGSADERDTVPQPVLKAATTSTSFLKLPPPKTPSTGLQLPPPANNATATTSSSSIVASNASKPVPKKKERGPLRMVLDLPMPSNSTSSGATPSPSSNDQGPVKKKIKLGANGSGSGTGLTGLAAMLPKPKHEAPVVSKMGATLGGGASGTSGLAMGSSTSQSGSDLAASSGPSTAFVPHTVGKGKAKAAEQSEKAADVASAEPVVDFFGLASVAPASSKSTSASTAKKSSMAISSAPSIGASPKPEPATPSASDPYPGFTQLPSGQWVAKDQATYEAWMAWQARQAAAGGDAAPKDFDQAEIERSGGMRDITEEQRAREAWASRPDLLEKRDAEEEKKKALAKLGKAGKIGTGKARAKGQLSALLAEAVENRAELEERIAQGRANRKSAGNKYGF